MPRKIVEKVESVPVSKSEMKRIAVQKESAQVKSEIKGKGVPDHVERQGNRVNTISNGERRIGMSKGATINMGNYESARVDVWMERVVEDNDRVMKSSINEMSTLLDDLLEDEVANLKD